MRTIALLGSTGSIGVSTLALVREFPERFKVHGMVAGRNVALLAKQVKEFAPALVSIERAEDIAPLHKLLGKHKVEILFGQAGATAVATAAPVDVVLAAIVGAAGLMPTLRGLLAGKEIALANKEALVMAGELFVKAAKKNRVRLLPVDSEHSAALQCLLGRPAAEVAKLTLTASGGPLRRHPDWRRATREEVLAHRAVEDVGFGLEAVVYPSPAGPSDLSRQVDQHGECGQQTAGRPHVELTHLVNPEIARGTLVGDRGVHVAVGDHHLTALQRRPDQGLDVVSAVGGEEQGLGAWCHVRAMQHELANGAAELCAARFSRHHHRVAKLLQPRPQQPALGRLA